jgi:hypothetical protein
VRKVNSPSVDQIQAGGEILLPEIHKLKLILEQRIASPVEKVNSTYS